MAYEPMNLVFCEVYHFIGGYNGPALCNVHGRARETSLSNYYKSHRRSIIPVIQICTLHSTPPPPPPHSSQPVRSNPQHVPLDHSTVATLQIVQLSHPVHLMPSVPAYTSLLIMYPLHYFVSYCVSRPSTFSPPLHRSIPLLNICPLFLIQSFLYFMRFE